MSVSASSELARLVDRRRFDADAVALLRENIHGGLLATSANLDGANFTTLKPRDLEYLFDEYDRRFFNTAIRTCVHAGALGFRVSTRMTSAGGKTVRFVAHGHTKQVRYEISVSTTLLYQCFNRDDHRPISVSGVSCRDRLEALQRIMEHELVHVVEGVLWERSNCAAARFRSIASRFFGHRGSTHALITPREHALVRFGIRPGVRVRFVRDGVPLVGFVNRVTRRATVLVVDPRGHVFTDGQRYATYYVPVDRLEPV